MIDIEWGFTSTENLYMANGHTGEIRKLLTDIGMAPFRVSKDGRFITLLKRSSSNENAVNIILFDVENESTIWEYEWQPEWTPRSFVGWEIIRRDNTFRIYMMVGGGYIGAEAELNPITLEFVTLWNEFRMEGYNYDWDIGWGDDVSGQMSDPNINLTR